LDQTLRQLSDRINLTSRTQNQSWNLHSHAEAINYNRGKKKVIFLYKLKLAII
jgi:hypothetical protein